MKIKRLFKYVSFLLLIGVLGFLFSFSKNRNLKKIIGDPIVEFEAGDNQFLTHAMVNKLLIQNDSSVKNQAKSVINLYSLEKVVSNNPFVENVAVFLTISGTLKAIIKQRTPVARVINNKDSYYIDKEGVMFPLSNNYSARVLLVTGVDKREEVKELLPLILFVLQDEFLQKEVVGIEKLAGSEYQLSVRSGDYKIDFGELTKMDLKFKKLKAFYNKTFEDKTIQNYKTINLKYHNQVVCAK